VLLVVARLVRHKPCISDQRCVNAAGCAPGMTDMRGGFHARGVRAGSLSAMAVPGAMRARRRAGRGRIGGPGAAATYGNQCG
jgi:hypothetical protein